nr:unnamed protein product [Digitaria exilis]
MRSLQKNITEKNTGQDQYLLSGFKKLQELILDQISYIFCEQRGQWKAATQSQEFLRTLQRYYNNAYTDHEKQDAINVSFIKRSLSDGNILLENSLPVSNCNNGESNTVLLPMQQMDDIREPSDSAPDISICDPNPCARSSLINSPMDEVSVESSTSYSEQGHIEEGRDDMDLSRSSSQLSDVRDYSDRFAHWVANGGMLCY